MPPETLDPRAGARSAEERGPEVWLALAINAQTPEEKRELAQRGLRANERQGGDPEFECLLLRQVFLAEFEDENYAAALEVAEEMVELGELADVARQDAARACLALGEIEAAVGHLRIASRVCPASRRPFHDWTLGSLLYLTGHADAAVAALARASRWATTQKPLYEAQLGLAHLAARRGSPDLAALREALADSPCASGYGQLVLGELCFFLGDHDEARRHLTSFVERVAGGRGAKAATLGVELAHARALLARLDA